MTSKRDRFWTVIAASAALWFVCGCQAHRQTQTSTEQPGVSWPADSPPEHISFTEAIGAIRVYKHGDCTVFVQGTTNGMEFGKYFDPLTSSYSLLVSRQDSSFSVLFATQDASGGWKIGDGFILMSPTGLSSWVPPGAEDMPPLGSEPGPQLINIGGVYLGGGKYAREYGWMYDYRRSQPGGPANAAPPHR